MASSALYQANTGWLKLDNMTNRRWVEFDTKNQWWVAFRPGYQPYNAKEEDLQCKISIQQNFGIVRYQEPPEDDLRWISRTNKEWHPGLDINPTTDDDIQCKILTHNKRWFPVLDIKPTEDHSSWISKTNKGWFELDKQVIQPSRAGYQPNNGWPTQLDINPTTDNDFPQLKPP